MRLDGKPVVTLHVGTPKSGTTSLQGILARNRELLLEHGYLYPGKNAGHFIEALSLRGSGFRGHTFDTSEGAWDRLVEEITAHDGPALISHEILGGSIPKVLKKAVKSLKKRQLRVVITCRDLGRQLPAVWQEGVKNGDTVTYSDFLTDAVETWEGPSSPHGMWRGQNLAGMGQRWGAAVGNENVHFVTVPPSGADHSVLWDRFRAATDLPDAPYVMPAKPRNPSLGAVETELLRRVVERLPEDVPWPTFARQVKRRLAQRQLVQHKSGGALTVPAGHRADTERIATEMLQAMRDGGFGIVGDLDDLRPSYRDDGTSPDEIGDAELLDRALEVLAPLVLRDPGPGKKQSG